MPRFHTPAYRTGQVELPCLQQPRMLAGEIVNSPEAASEFLATDQEAAEPEKNDAKPIEAEQ